MMFFLYVFATIGVLCLVGSSLLMLIATRNAAYFDDENHWLTAPIPAPKERADGTDEDAQP